MLGFPRKTLFLSFMFLATVNFQTTIKNTKKIVKLMLEIIIFSKYFVNFFFEKYQLFLLFVDRACEILQTPLSSCRLFF